MWRRVCGMDQSGFLVDLLVALDVALLAMIILKCILAVLTIDALLLIYLIVAWYIICVKDDIEDI